MWSGFSRLALFDRGATVVWWASLPPADQDRPVLARLDPDERDRIAHYRHEADRRRSLAAHALLHAALHERLGEREPIRIVQRCPRCGGPHGRPLVVDELGRPRRDVHVSLTHAGELVGVATSAQRVGIDVEPMAPAAGRGIDVALAPAESEAIASFASEERYEALFSTWTRKEALYKAGCGTGDLDRIDLSPLLGRRPACGDPWSRWRLWDLRPASGYAGAVAVAAPE